MKTLFLIICFAFGIFANAQISTNSQWTWMKGDSTADQYGVYGTQGIAAATNKPGGRAYSVSWADLSGNFWLFGGHSSIPGIPGNEGWLNDLWKYSLLSNQWTWVGGDSIANVNGSYGSQGIAAAANKPGARNGTVTWTDLSGNLWLFGGAGFDANSAGNSLNDLWRYNLSTNQWTWMKGDSITDVPGVYGTQGTPAAANKPGGRSGSISWTDLDGNLWLFGGYGYSAVGFGGELNDLWKYDPVLNRWTWMKGDSIGLQYGIYGSQGIAAAANKPGARSGSATWTDLDGNVWLFGGSGIVPGNWPSNVGWQNDLWKYNLSTNQWTWMKGDSILDVRGVYGSQGIAAAANKLGYIASHTFIQ